MPIKIEVDDRGVEDNELRIDDSEEKTLINDGYTIVDNATGRIYRVLERYPPSQRGGSDDVILLDIKMPEMDGIELYYYMKNISEALVNKVIFITGDVMSVDTHRFLEKTASVFIPKPFDADALRDIVNRRLAER